jgi:ribosome-binding protein aMBF1 (putative translation factor)
MSNTYSLYQEKLRKQRENPETSRAGLKWEVEEDNTLIDKINDNESIEDIAKQLQRTAGSIKTWKRK